MDMLRLGIKMEMGRRLLLLHTCRRMVSISPSAAASTLSKPLSSDGEYVDEAIYPEIQDLSFKARKERQNESWHEEIRAVPTVEEKMIKINMPRYYGYKVFNLSDSKLPYNCLPAMQHYTRTVYENIQVSTNPENVNMGADVQKLDVYVDSVKSEVQDAIEYAYEYFNYKYAGISYIEPQERENNFARHIVGQINRTLINVLSPDFSHLKESEIDYSPRHEAFWAVGGINPPKNVVKSKEGRKWQKEMANDPYDRFMQYYGNPFLTVRHRNQIPSWKTETESINADLAKTIPRFNYDPRSLGYACGYKHLTNIPGFWPGSANVFGNISYQSRAFLQTRPDSYGAEDCKDALHAHAIQSSFAWLIAQASYNGFTTFDELTYPMNTQTVLTNGRVWSFYEYQLNTLLVHSKHVDDNPRVNFCRGTPELNLYGGISDTGKIENFNVDVLRHLIRIYMNAPTVQRTKTELQPYLSKDVKVAADYKNPAQREFLERVYKNLMSNRPRHLAIPEIYLWEKIYKIDHKTRQMEAKRRFFELGINPWKRTLDQHQKEYIPRAVRTEGPKSKNKWKQTFYP